MLLLKENKQIHPSENTAQGHDEIYLGKSTHLNKISGTPYERHNTQTRPELPCTNKEETRIVSDNVLNRDSESFLPQLLAGGGRYIDVKILSSDERVDLNDLVEKLANIDERAGALVLFIGFVKGLVENQVVNELEYTAVIDIALKQMEKIAIEEAERHDLSAVTIWHYIGVRKKGELTLIIATVGKDRSSTQEGNSAILERVKKEVPIFKLERRSDGEYWIIGDGVRYPRPVPKKN